MAEAERSGSVAPAAAQDFDPARQIAALRSEAAERFDPVRFHFIETLARRGLEHQGEVKRRLDDKLAVALAAYRQAFEQTRNDASDIVARTTAQHPAAGDELQGLFAAGDFGGIRRLVAGLEKSDTPAPLAELSRYLAQQAADPDANPTAEIGSGSGSIGSIGSHSELKTIRHFRNTWSKLSVDKQVAQAIAQPPEHAGPLNSHLLLLRSLSLMREIAPDYLSRFMSYADTLLWLDLADKKSRPALKKPATTKTAKK